MCSLCTLGWVLHGKVFGQSIDVYVCLHLCKTYVHFTQYLDKNPWTVFRCQQMSTKVCNLYITLGCPSMWQLSFRCSMMTFISNSKVMKIEPTFISISRAQPWLYKGIHSQVLPSSLFQVQDINPTVGNIHMK